eukprot:TRINITY_DN6552_c0_g1_i3.p1 TRINITY_DN6552_c0_g1~~TRINITY_DN6552_c0_g1_i3.p1  ORF type:complete len:356 (+),score=72.49 TRINITY_DN6552_c0_g1_i3:1108-2175(+)
MGSDDDGPKKTKKKTKKKESTAKKRTRKAPQKPDQVVKIWVQIAVHFPTRVDTQCRERYQNGLTLGINTSAWTEAERREVEILVNKYGPGKWAQIARELSTPRTDNQVYRFVKKEMTQIYAEYEANKAFKKVMAPNLSSRSKKSSELTLNDIDTTTAKKSRKRTKSEVDILQNIPRKRGYPKIEPPSVSFRLPNKPEFRFPLLMPSITTYKFLGNMSQDVDYMKLQNMNVPGSQLPIFDSEIFLIISNWLYSFLAPSVLRSFQGEVIDSTSGEKDYIEVFSGQFNNKVINERIAEMSILEDNEDLSIEEVEDDEMDVECLNQAEERSSTKANNPKGEERTEEYELQNAIANMMDL